MTLLSRLKTDRKTQALIGLIAILVIFIVALVYFFTQIERDTIGDLNTNSDPVQSDARYRKLDGILVGEDVPIDTVPRAVIIENLEKVRPQSGLSRAGVVYEALAEGGITRFMALYDADPIGSLGPVRSARSYFVDIASEYDPLFAHAGGSPDALLKIPNAQLEDVNQIGGDQQYFARDTALDAPHNLFTSSELLTYALRDKRILDEKSLFEAWSFMDDVPSSQRIDREQVVDIDFSSSDYSVSYEYDFESNVYLRSNGGVAHVDLETGEQIQPKNVIIQYVDQRVVDEEGRLVIDVVGEGDALVFSNGSVTKGSWIKRDEKSRTKFVDEEEGVIKLVRGQTWVELVPKEKEVIF